MVSIITSKHNKGLRSSFSHIHVANTIKHILGTNMQTNRQQADQAVLWMK